MRTRTRPQPSHRALRRQREIDAAMADGDDDRTWRLILALTARLPRVVPSVQPSTEQLPVRLILVTERSPRAAPLPSNEQSRRELAPVQLTVV